VCRGEQVAAMTAWLDKHLLGTRYTQGEAALRIRIRINLSCWIRIQEGKEGPQKKKKSEEISCFELLDVLFSELKFFFLNRYYFCIFFLHS
jgi:hypothetical protein